MLRLQQDKTLSGVLDEESYYRPPWRDKRYYLLDGHGHRIIFVDENYDPEVFDPDDPNSKYDDSFPVKRPTATLVTHFKEKGQLEALFNAPQILKLWGDNDLYYDPAKEMYPKDYPKELKIVEEKLKRHCLFPAGPPGNKPRVNPSKIDPRWLDALDTLENNPFECIWIKMDLKLCEQELSKGDEKGSEYFGNLMELPFEVWEKMVMVMNSLSFLSMSKAFEKEGLDNMLWDALKHNKARKRIPDFWFRGATENLNQQRLNEITCSFFNLLNERRRILINASGQPQDSYVDVASRYDCEDVCQIALNLNDTFINGKMSLRSMDKLEEKVKTVLQLHFEEIASLKPKPMVSKRPEVIVDVSGSLCYFAISPWRHSNLVIMEDLDKCEERHSSLVCLQDLRFIKTMYFPTYLMDKQVGKLPRTENLPKIQRLLISSCDECTHGRVLQGDVTGFVINHPSESKRQLYHRMDPIVASLGNVFALWQDPLEIQLFKIHRVEGSAYQSTLFQTLKIADAFPYWNLQCNYTQYFIPVLRLIKNNAEMTDWQDPKQIEQVYGKNQLTDDFYEITFINMLFGNEIISVRSPYIDFQSGYNAPLEIWHQISHIHSEYYYHNARKYRSLLEIPYSGAFGYDVFVFWNHQALAVSLESESRWFFYPWKMAIEGLEDQDSSLSKDLQVTQMNVCSREVLAAIVNGNLILFKMGKIDGGEYKDYKREPEFFMTPIRLVIMDLMSKDLFVEKMTYDFDQGNPYFFLVLKEKEEPLKRDEPELPETNFFFKRICFESKDQVAEKP